MVVVRRLLGGALAGCAATAAMSVVMLAARRIGATPQVEPEAITEAGLRALDVDVSERGRKLLASCSHVGYGAAMGSLFGLLYPLMPFAPLATGPLFGLGLGVASYEGWVPAAGVLPAMHDQAPARRRQLLLAHLVYGAVLGRLAAALVPFPPTGPVRPR